MKQRKNYEAPAMELVELKVQGSLLAGSGMNGNIEENGNLNGFDESWN